ncbi:MAG: C25 family cysteine peptidase, partial [Anaerolineales bacterium]
GQLSNVGELGNIGTLVGVSAHGGTTPEQISYSVQELYGHYYIAVIAHGPAAVGTSFTLTADVAPPVDPYAPITIPIPTYPTPLDNPAVNTLILFNGSRLDQLYGAGTITSTGLLTKIQDLKNNSNVNGEAINLDSYPDIVSAYALWDTQPGNPLAANFVAGNIKSLLYGLAPAYPNVKYLVIVGDDRVIPHRRIQDLALVANERHYASIAYTPVLSGSLGLRYFLTDDYYAGLLPLPYAGREVYLPQIALGRLVESPAEIVNAINGFLAQPVVSPNDALVTGYDFLIDQASAISTTFSAQGVTLFTLINNTWTAADFRSYFFPVTRDLNSLNSHFEHHRFFPNGAEYVYATEVASSFSGSVIFTVGCHSGLNVPDADQPDPTQATDWAQAFLREQGTFIGNTGYGYGDSDLVAYSE